MNDLEKYFRENKDRLIYKWHHYFDIYDRHFQRFRGKEITVVEIGIFQGGSLQMWKKYFGDKAKIYGIDINPACKALEEENIKVFIGSQSDREFLREVRKQIPKIDILIDDGGHTMKQQIVSFEELFDHVKDDGVYLCEDLHTSYWLGYGGGHKRRRTFIEFSKNFIDDINAWFSEQRSLKVNSITKSVRSIHYYTSVVVMEKGKMEKPIESFTGKKSYESPPKKQPLIRRTLTFINRGLNKVLRFFRLPESIAK